MKNPSTEEKELLEQLGETIGYAQAYVKRQVDFHKLEFAEKTAKLMATLATVAVLVGLGMVIVCMFSIGLGYWLTSKLGAPAPAFFLIAGVYVVIGLIIFSLRRKLLTNPLLTVIISEIFPSNSENPNL